MEVSSQITELIADWQGGHEGAFEQLFALVYDELRSLASSYMQGERADHALQTTTLVNEAYIKFVEQKASALHKQVHFLVLAAKVMRQILIDPARSRQFEKRGAGAGKISLDNTPVLSDERAAELGALEEALKELVKIAPRQSQIAERRLSVG